MTSSLILQFRTGRKSCINCLLYREYTLCGLVYLLNLLSFIVSMVTTATFFFSFLNPVYVGLNPETAGVTDVSVENKLVLHALGEFHPTNLRCQSMWTA